MATTSRRTRASRSACGIWRAQIKGTAQVQRSGQVYDDAVAWVHETKPDTDPKAAVVLRIDSVYVCHSGPDRGKDVVLP